MLKKNPMLSVWSQTFGLHFRYTESHWSVDIFCRKGADCVQPSAIERAHATVSVSACVLELRGERDISHAATFSKHKHFCFISLEQFNR